MPEVIHTKIRILFTGMGVDGLIFMFDFSCTLHAGKTEIPTRFSPSKSSSEAKAICKWPVNYEEGEEAEFFVLQCQRQS